MRKMRRKDRERDRNFAEMVVDKCLYAVLATVNGDGSPYCVPLSIVREGEWIYFHCAREGHKIDNLKNRNRVCLACVGEAYEPPDHFTVVYESAVVFGAAEEVQQDEEKLRALRLLCQRHTPANMAAFDAGISREFGAAGVWKIHIDEISGKQRLPPVPQGA
ncbi:MAG: pyridoxamine 5'-phosphate oxidase family protein [Treponema sp.]|jgi:nitroimidazol reductase NimA-like FMN-containing flavoprotein (pyridoxamine 5'-phosphate oxidase superfamily)|nr:pyridoxamine 5'-phosphate oxidase family protein [Treponema sp.]